MEITLTNHPVKVTKSALELPVGTIFRTTGHQWYIRVENDFVVRFIDGLKYQAWTLSYGIDYIFGPGDTINIQF